MNALMGWLAPQELSQRDPSILLTNLTSTRYATRAQFIVALSLDVIHEVPIKNFFTRCVLAYG